MSVQSLPCPVQGCPETLPATEISLHLGEAHNALDTNDRLSLFHKAMAPQAFKGPGGRTEISYRIRINARRGERGPMTPRSPRALIRVR